MITNTTCTIFRREGSQLIRILTSPCMWQETEAIEVKKYGEKSADKAAVYIPGINADIRKGDFILKGVHEELTDKQAYSSLTVSSINRNDFGSPHMQHLKLGVR